MQKSLFERVIIKEYIQSHLGVYVGRVEGIFDPTLSGWVKKNSTQPNPSHKSNPI